MVDSIFFESNFMTMIKVDVPMECLVKHINDYHS